MSNPTSNFNWQMPTSTDLVTDLPADFEVFGQAVDTSLMDLKGGTTGQVLSKASSTDMDFTWTAIDPLVILDAKGDLITATAADTPTRLPVGTNGQVLTANSAQSTGLQWTTLTTGGMTQLASGSLTGSTVSMTSISGSYKDLVLYIRDYYFSANEHFRFQLNANTGTVYNSGGLEFNYSTATQGMNTVVQTSFGRLTWGYQVGNTDNNNFAQITIADYANTSSRKIADCMATYTDPSSDRTAFTNYMMFNSTTAVSQIDIYPASGTFSGGTYVLYGVS